MRRVAFWRFPLIGAVLALFLAFPSASWALNALIVHDGVGGIEADALGNLTAKLVAAGYTVTPNVGVPVGSLSAFKEVWDIRFNNTTPLTPSDDASYLTFLQGGGSLFLMGENLGFVTRDNSIALFIGLAGGGSLGPFQTPANLQNVRAPLTGPNPLSTILFQAAAGTFSPGNGAFGTLDASNIGSTIIFGPGNLSNAPTGALIVVWDVNFMQAGADANSQTFLQNLVAYLTAPTVVNTAAPSSVPLPPTVILTLTGIFGILMFAMWRRMRGQASV